MHGRDCLDLTDGKKSRLNDSDFVREAPLDEGGNVEGLDGRENRRYRAWRTIPHNGASRSNMYALRV
jgi:hypothetical protein